MKKKLAILLSLALLVTSVASLGLSAVADSTTEGTVVFESDFSTMPTEVVAFNSGNNYFQNVGVADDVLACNTRVTNGKSAWHNVFTVGEDAPFMVWESGETGDNVYKIEFDWTLPVATDSGKDSAELRMLIYIENTTSRIIQPTIVKGEQAAGTSGKYEATLQFNGTDGASNVDGTSDYKVYLAFLAAYIDSFTIDNLKITDMTPVDSGVMFNSDFSTMPTEVVAFNSGNNYFQNVGVADGVLACNTRVTNGKSAWHNVFTVGEDAPFMVWESGETGDNVYKIEFDWTLPVATDSGKDSAELRMLIYIENTTSRIIQPTIVKGEQAAGTSGKYEATLQFNGTDGASNVDGTSDYKVYLAFLAAYIDSFTIDNLKITDLSPADSGSEGGGNDGEGGNDGDGNEGDGNEGEGEGGNDGEQTPDEPIGTETVILNTDFSTATVDGLLALGGGTARYYGNAEGDINGIVDGAWKSFKANYAEDTASKLQWYSAWGTHTTDNPIIWGQNYEYRVEFDWAIPGACTNAQFRLIMESAHLDNPSLNDNGDKRPYQVGVYNTDGTYGESGYAITQTEASSGSFKATFAVNNIELNANNTPADGETMRFVIRSQLETFTIDNLKITRVAIAAPEKEEDKDDGSQEEPETKVLVETDFTSVPLGLGNTWGGAYEVVGVNDELDVWQADAEETPTGWKMIFNTVYDICPIVWGEGHSYKVELSYSLPKGSGETGRFELVMDKDDGTQDHRGMQTTVFRADKTGVIEASDTVYTYETTFVTSGPAAKGELNTDDKMMLKFMAKTLPAIYIHSVKITDLNAALTPEIKLPEVDDSEEEVSQPITVTVSLVDKDGKPMANQDFKLDAGDILTTDSNGRYEFKDVISGPYTINLVDGDGNVVASAYYTILAGESTDISGNFATIDKTVEALYITMQYADGKLTVENMTVEAPVSDETDSDDDDDLIDIGGSTTDEDEEDVSSPETGETFPVWALAILAVSGAVVLTVSKKRAFGTK